MKFSLSWLYQHLDTKVSQEELLIGLTALGLEVEGVNDPTPDLAPFIIARVLEAEPHPNADRLRVCKVDSGSGILQIVCGAPNARAGLTVILARPGDRIPSTGDVLKKGAIRGVESQGMLCSWRELSLGEDHSGIAEMDPELAVGSRLIDAISIDPVVEVSLTPNRGDCLGVRGIARDLAAAGLGTLKLLAVEPVVGTFPSPVSVQMDFPPEDAKACPLFVGRFIHGVKNGESPDWLKKYLESVGLRPISALVDITNYFTIDLGRPLHVFDGAKIAEDRLILRFARPGEVLHALNDKAYELTPAMTVIADGDSVQSLGGIMGGSASGCSPETVDVFLEVALFDPVRTGATGRALAIDSDARHRFERQVDPDFCITAAEMATRMILDLCGGEASELVIAGKVPSWQRSIRFATVRMKTLAGLEITSEKITQILKNLGCRVELESQGVLLVSPPSWRPDLTGEHDLVEEVARVHGYDAIPTVSLPRQPMPKPVLTPEQRRQAFVRRTLAARGMIEAVTWSFLSSAQASLFGGGAKEIHLANPISADLDCMRPSVLPNLLAAAGRNADRGMKDVVLFEVGPQFAGDRPEDQRPVVAGVRTGRSGPRHWAETPRPVDAFDAKADAVAAIAAAGGPVETLQVGKDAPSWYHPGRSGTLKLGNKTLAAFGEIHPAVLKAMNLKGSFVGFEVFFDALPPIKAKATKAKPLLKVASLLPLERDFAFIVDQAVTADSVLRAARNADKALIVGASAFDLYEGTGLPEGKKSLAISVLLQPTEKTLTDAEIEAISAKVVSAVAKATGAILRG